MYIILHEIENQNKFSIKNVYGVFDTEDEARNFVSENDLTQNNNGLSAFRIMKVVDKNLFNPNIINIEGKQVLPKEFYF